MYPIFSLFFKLLPSPEPFITCFHQKESPLHDM